jgi:hypothetical protein
MNATRAVGRCGRWRGLRQAARWRLRHAAAVRGWHRATSFGGRIAAQKNSQAASSNPCAAESS